MKRYKALLVAVLLGPCISCSSRDLSRSRAAELIASQQHLPTTQTITINHRYLQRSWSNPVVGFGKITICNYQGQQYADVESRLAYYRSVNLITIGTETENGDCPSTWATVTLTDEGRKYLAVESAGAFQVKVFDLAFGEVTGIQTNEPSKTAKADYTVRLINVTPFGNNISPEQDGRIAMFSQFDDGWRIEPAPVRTAAIRFRPMTLPSPAPVSMAGVAGKSEQPRPAPSRGPSPSGPAPTPLPKMVPLNAETSAQLVGDWLGYDWHFDDNVQVDDVKPSWEASIKQEHGRYYLHLRMPQDDSRTMTLVGDLQGGMIHLETHLDLQLPTLELSQDGSVVFMSQYLHLKLKRRLAPRDSAGETARWPRRLGLLASGSAVQD